MSRAERRHHQHRIDAKAKDVAHKHGNPEGWMHYRHNLARCSCHMCGNPRRHYNMKTIQELRHEQGD